MSTVTDPAALAAVVERLTRTPRIGVDCEGDGFHRYRARLCMIQVAAPDVEAIVDPLALDDLSPLAPLFDAPTPIKVFHDVGFDAKMLAGRGVGLDGVFDTAVAARFLSYPSTGLAAMLGEHFDVEVDKGFQRADWGERPVTDERLVYLLDDVRYLVALSEILEADARERDILEEIDEETRYAIARSLEPEKEIAPWTRIKGRRGLKGRRLALLAALADAREEFAEERDVPPFRIAPNRAIEEAAQKNARTVRQLKGIRGLRKMGAAALARALERAEDDGPPEDDRPTPPPPEVRARTKAREKSLTAWRAEEAERRGVDVQVVLPGHCLRDIANLDDLDAISEVAGFGEKRARLYLDALTELVRGAA